MGDSSLYPYARGSAQGSRYGRQYGDDEVQDFLPKFSFLSPFQSFSCLKIKKYSIEIVLIIYIIKKFSLYVKSILKY